MTTVFILYNHFYPASFNLYGMTNGFEKVEDKAAEDEKRRRKLDKKESSLKPETLEKTRFYADKKRGDAITENIEETRNVQ